MRNINSIACQLLNCGYGDIEFLENLLETYQLDIDIDEIRMMYGEVNNINTIIYEAFNQIKNKFLEENEEAIKSLGYTTEDIEDNEKYTIDTNFLCSSLRFSIPEIDEIYQNWR